MEQLQTPNQVENTEPLLLKPKRNIFFRVIKGLGIAIGSYIMIGFILFLINPLFALLVMSPVFYIQNLYSQMTDSHIEEKISQLEEAGIMVPEKLMEADCSGLFGTETFNKRDTETGNYSDKIKADKLSHIATCKTPTGTLVFNSYYVADSRRTEVYVDNFGNGEIEKLLTLNAIFIEVAIDSDKNYYILEPVINGPIVDRKVYLFDKNDNKIKLVKRPASISVCKLNLDQEEECQTWPINLNPYSTSNDEEKNQRIEKVKGALNFAKEISSKYKLSSADQTYKGFCNSQIYNDEILKQLSDAGAGVRCNSNEISYGIEGFLSGQTTTQVLCVDTTGEIKEDKNRQVSMIDFVSKNHYECQYAWPDGK